MVTSAEFSGEGASEQLRPWPEGQAGVQGSGCRRPSCRDAPAFAGGGELSQEPGTGEWIWKGAAPHLPPVCPGGGGRGF